MTQDTVFTHRPQPPFIPEHHPDQRWFCGMGYRSAQTPDGFGRALVYVLAGSETARVTLSTGLDYVGAHVTINLPAPALRSLGHALIDAADDLSQAAPPAKPAASRPAGASNGAAA